MEPLYEIIPKFNHNQRETAEVSSEERLTVSLGFRYNMGVFWAGVPADRNHKPKGYA